MSGGRIRAALGDVPVESIVPGQEVVVVRGGEQVLEPVKWVGYTYLDVSRNAHPEDVAPIRFRKDAIADNQPERDLIVSPEHCLIIDGRCVPAKLLVNGGSIVRLSDHGILTYHHIELERHGILLAENTPTESYLDTGNRSLFDNADEPRQLHPSFIVDPTAERWKTDACAPLAIVPDEVEPIWNRLADRSEALGYPIMVPPTVDDADVHILADGKVIRPVSDRDSRYVFTIPAGAKSVQLMSRFCIPADKMVAGIRDTRRLGLSVNWIAIRGPDGDTIIPADHPELTAGWHDAEADGNASWRWTHGAASIPWDNITGTAVLTVRCSTVGQYPVYQEQSQRVA